MIYYKIITVAISLILMILILYNIYYYYNISNIHNIPNNPPFFLYINLKHRNDRKLRLLKQINSLAIPNNKIIRIDAIKKRIGHYGCALSHIKALKYIIHNNIQCALILEDDFVWRYSTNKTINVLNKVLMLNDWQVCLLACNGKRKHKNKYSQTVINCHTASAYIIRLNYAHTLLKHWSSYIESGQLNNYKYKPGTAIDQTWKILQTRDRHKWITTKPLLGYQAPSYSDIRKQLVNYKV